MTLNENSINKTLGQKIRSLSIKYPQFEKDIELIETYANEVSFKGESSILILWGKPGSGKTARLNRFVEIFTKKILVKSDSIQQNHQKEVPVVKVELQMNPTISSMCSSILERLDVPVGKYRTDAEKTVHVVNSLKLAKTRVVIFDEAQHLYEATSQKSTSAKLANSRNWLKYFGNQLGILIVLSGMETVHMIFGNDFQLERRTLDSIPVQPFDIKNKESWKDFLSVLKAYEKVIHESGYSTVSFTDSIIAKRFFHATGGYIGILTSLLNELAIKCKDYKETNKSIDIVDLQRAHHTISMVQAKQILDLSNAFPDAFSEDYDFNHPLRIGEEPSQSKTVTDQSFSMQF